MSFDGLRIGASGLAAAQRGVNVAGHNTTNAATPGYTRQRVELSAGAASNGVSGMVGTGVALGELSRVRNEFADSAYRTSASNSGQSAAATEVLTRVGTLLGPLDGGVPAALTGFYNAASTLSMRPDDVAARGTFLTAARSLSTAFSDLARGIDAIGPDVTGKAGDVVARANAMSAHVADLNKQIADARVSGQVPADLLDKRDQAVDELASLVGGRVGATDSLGQVTVFVASQPLVAGERSFALQVTPSPAGPTVSFADGQPAVIPGGTLGGLLAATSTITELRAGLNAVAVEVMTQVNTIHATGTDLDGNRGGALFVGTDAATMRVASSMTARGVAASGSGAAMDGSVALALSSARGTPLADGATVSERLGGWTASVGLSISEARVRSSTTAVVTANLEATRTSEHAVNVDEEMVEMIRFQRAYQASARVVSVADELLDTIINRMGR